MVTELLPRHAKLASPPQETITTALRPDAGGRAVAGQDRHVIAKRQQLGLDPANEVVVAAIGKIGAADRAGEQRVPDQREALGRGDEHEMPRCMTGKMQHVEAQAADFHAIAFLEPAGWRDGARVADTKALALLGK